MPARILIVDDLKHVRASLSLFLASRGHDVKAVASGPECIQAVQQQRYDLILLDLNMKPINGFETLARIRGDLPHTQIWILTAADDVITRERALAAGADDFISKDVDSPDETNRRIQAALEEAGRQLHQHFGAPNSGSGQFVGRSQALQRVHDLIQRVAPTDANVLVLGETGTGKELVARALHASSPRAAKPFVAINCAAVAETLLESEMFGHVRGAFTGADRSQMGKYEAADGGTLFLDEISKSSLAFQTKLLRLLETHRFTRIGATEETSANVRLICASGPSLHKAMADGRFLIDLYYRINVIPITMPPLRERVEDIPDLVTHFVHEYSQKRGTTMTIPPEVMDKFLHHRWPGNIRELRNLIERAVILAEGTVLPDPFTWEPTQADPEPQTFREAVAKFEQTFLTALLVRHGGNRQLAAEEAGIDPTTLGRKLKRSGERGD